MGSLRIIGFGHRSRVGKDTAVDFLAGHIRQTTRNKLVTTARFAFKIKAMCHDLYGWAGLQDGEFYEKPENEHLKNIKLPVIDKTPVEIWVEFGTTVGRSIYTETWVQYPFTKKYDYLLFRDVRFPNEAAKIKSLGGVVYKIENPRILPTKSAADAALEGYKHWDGILVNDGDLKTFNTLIINTFKDLI